MNGVILLGHGSRAEGAGISLEHIARALALRLPTMAVRAAHRELCEPTLEFVVAELAASGVRRIVVLPYFLHRGLHMQEDIPEQLAVLRRNHPAVQLVLAEHLGYDDRLVGILLDRLAAAVGATA
jgi:sirohydrochlorin cobaltochelatase